MERKTSKFFSFEFKLAVAASCVGREELMLVMLLLSSSTPLNFSPANGQVGAWTNGTKWDRTEAAGVLRFGRALISAEEAGALSGRDASSRCAGLVLGLGAALGRPREPWHGRTG